MKSGKKTALVVDDSELTRRVLSQMLEEEFDLLQARNGTQAIELLMSEGAGLSIILLDIVMPERDGFQVLAYMRRVGLIGRVPVVMITASDEEELVGLAYDMGASDVIRKPFNRNIVVRRIRNLVDLYERQNNLESLVLSQTEELRQQTSRTLESNEQMIDALSTVIEYRSLESGHHIRRIRGLTRVLLEYLARRRPEYRLDEEAIGMITRASAMHDVGKIAIPDSVLLKPGRLTPEEFEVMKTHTTKGCEILYRLSGIDDQRYLTLCHDICLYHHERWDGKGYPDGLKGDEIPIWAQAVALADVYDALTHPRVYKPAYSPQTAARMIREGECGALPPLMLESFDEVLPQFERVSNEFPDNEF